MPTPPEYDVVTFGETMLRLSPPGYGRLEEATSLDVRIGGSESNTAVALARLGLRTAWWSRLPASPLGRRIENEIRRWGVDTTQVLWDEDPGARAGLYFFDFGVAPRGTDVIYDRAASAASRIAPADISAGLIASARLLHLSGITPALSHTCSDAVRDAIAVAVEAKVPVSFDVNYRAKLWSPEEASKVLTPLMERVTILLCPISDAALLFGLTGDGAAVARALRERFGVTTAVVTCGGDGAVACDDRGEWSATPFPLDQVVDRVGAGDAFNAGVLMGYLQGDIKLGLEYGTAMAALKHTIPGDLLLATRQEIEIARAGGFAGIRR